MILAGDIKSKESQEAAVFSANPSIQFEVNYHTSQKLRGTLSKVSGPFPFLLTGSDTPTSLLT